MRLPLILSLIPPKVQAANGATRCGREGDQRFPHMDKLPAPVSRLVQCLVEEAEATPETTTQVLQLISFFARGCNSQEDWRALSKGPYGAELLHHSFKLYSSPQLKEMNYLQTCTYIAAARFGKELAEKGIINPALRQLFTSTTEAEILQGLCIVAGKVIERMQEEMDASAAGT